MKALNLPATWPAMGIDAKIAYLVESKQASCYRVGAQMVAKMRKAKPAPFVSALPAAPQWYNKD
jgi:hypothetical protein